MAYNGFRFASPVATFLGPVGAGNEEVYYVGWRRWRRGKKRSLHSVASLGAKIVRDGMLSLTPQRGPTAKAQGTALGTDLSLVSSPEMAPHGVRLGCYGDIVLMLVF